MSSLQGKIVLYKTSICPRCPRAIQLLEKILKEYDYEYSEVVEELNVEEDTDARTDLLMEGFLSTPVVRVGEILLGPDKCTNEEVLRTNIGKLFA
ncbi:MAG: glutaredoxin domain-containing protein [Candidatus Hodarchaeota archaeon]